MARETECARLVMEQLSEMFPNKRMLRVFEVMKFTGLDRKTCNKLFPFDNGYISTIKLANKMG